jgi:hypothetical protein
MGGGGACGRSAAWAVSGIPSSSDPDAAKQKNDFRMSAPLSRKMDYVGCSAQTVPKSEREKNSLGDATTFATCSFKPLVLNSNLLSKGFDGLRLYSFEPHPKFGHTP